MAGSGRFAAAVHVLTLMAASGEDPVKSELVACSVNTNPVVIRRIVCQLADAGLVVSQAGCSGGSRLAKSAASISLLDIYNAVGQRGPFELRRQPPNPACPIGNSIEGALETVLGQATAAVERVLAGITIQDFLHSVRAGSLQKGEAAAGRGSLRARAAMRREAQGR